MQCVASYCFRRMSSPPLNAQKAKASRLLGFGSAGILEVMSWISRYIESKHSIFKIWMARSFDHVKRDDTFPLGSFYVEMHFEMLNASPIGVYA